MSEVINIKTRQDCIKIIQSVYGSPELIGGTGMSKNNFCWMAGLKSVKIEKLPTSLLLEVAQTMLSMEGLKYKVFMEEKQ